MTDELVIELEEEPFRDGAIVVKDEGDIYVWEVLLRENQEIVDIKFCYTEQNAISWLKYWVFDCAYNKTEYI